MTAHLTINGLTIPTFRDTVTEEPEDVGENFDRGLIGNILRTRTGRLRKWRFTMPLKQVSEAEPYRKWLEGDGQHWPFKNDAATAANALSFLGATNSVAGTFTSSIAGGYRNSRLTVSSGSQFGVRLANRLNVQRRTGWSPTTDGWTLAVWRKFQVAEGTTAAFHHVIMKGAVEFLRAASSGNPAGVKQYLDGVLGSYALGRAIQVHSSTSPYVALFGKLTDNTSADVDYSDWTFLPYEIPDAWVASLYAEALARDLANLPKVSANGTFLQDGPVDVVCRVTTIHQAGGVVAGSFQNNLRALDVEMFETI